MLLDYKHRLAKRLKELRLENNLTLEDVARITCVSQRAVVSNWEATGYRQRVPSLETLLVLRDLYNVSLDYLVGVPRATR